MARILIVDDEKNIRTTLRRALDLEGIEADVAEDAGTALQKVKDDPPELILLDLKLPDRSGLEVLEELNKAEVRPAVVMMSGHGTLEAAIAATRLGALDFLEKPLEMERMLLTVKNALRLDALESEVGAIKRSVERRYGMVGNSAALGEVIDAVRLAAPTKARVLIHGESGVGKELVARAIHMTSRRADGPYIKLNCAAIPQTLVESELFGHEKGAFTGADKRHVGRFERADGGTLFLDEIGEMPLAVQAILLRVLQEGHLERVGGTVELDVDVRVIAATNRNLMEEVEKGTFREDLYYRLNVIPISVPSLRERKEDISDLAQVLLESSCEENDLDEKVWTDGALKALMAHDWPGNIRELNHVVDRLAIMTPGVRIEEGDVKRSLPGAIKMTGDTVPTEGKLYALVEGFERRIIEDRITRFEGNMSKTAVDLGLERSHLYKKVRRLGIRRPGEAG
ncbi:MAG: sigma-54-dependent Fis family transcriptional regulator [Deltaproteobacteria bacterium]|nr:sigma-54-dependent Fis family transcriptional regulator [Deltaproteobacteria bacterium]